MKNALKLLLLLMLTAGMSSCDWIKGLADVEIDTTIESTLNIVSDEAELKSTEDHRIDAEETTPVLNQDLAQYGDLIHDIETRNVTFTVEDVDSTGVVIHAGTEFKIYSQTDPSLEVVVTLGTDWPIEIGYSVSLDPDAYSDIDGLLASLDPITFSVYGSCNKGNVHIDLNYGIDVTVTSNPL